MREALGLSFLAACSEVENIGELHYDAEEQSMEIGINESPLCDGGRLQAGNIATAAFPSDVFSPDTDLRVQVVESTPLVDDYTLEKVNLQVDPNVESHTAELDSSSVNLWSGDFVMGTAYAESFQAALMQVLEEGKGEKECL